MLTDRSRMETNEVCPRLRLLRYHLGGLGMVPASEGYELSFGRIYHEAMEGLVKRALPDETVIQQAVNGLRAAISVMPLQPSPIFLEEQSYLMAGMLWGWVTVKRPEFERDYEVLSLEQEFLWNMGDMPDPFLQSGGSEPLVDMVRLDALAKDRLTEALYYKEYKTSAYADDRWASGYEHNAQVMANLQAVEDALGIRPAGILVEGHRKGGRRRDTAKASKVSGLEIQDSIFCYAYETKSGELFPEWRYGGIRTPLWDLGWTPREWVQKFLAGGTDSPGSGGLQESNLLRQQYVQLPPISPDPYHVDRWRRQKLAQEGRIYWALRELNDPGIPERRRIQLLDDVFPLYEQSCIRYGRKCSHYEICHDRAVAADPLAGNRFVARTPHHAAEADEAAGADLGETPGGSGGEALAPDRGPGI